MTIKFNPEGKSVLTFGEALGPAMKITGEAEAKRYFEDYVAYTRRMLIEHPRSSAGDPPLTAEEIVKINLGYYAGYYDAETMERVSRLFCTTHPIFGDKAFK